MLIAFVPSVSPLFRMQVVRTRHKALRQGVLGKGKRRGIEYSLRDPDGR